MVKPIYTTAELAEALGMSRAGTLKMLRRLGVAMIPTRPRPRDKIRIFLSSLERALPDVVDRLEEER